MRKSATWNRWGGSVYNVVDGAFTEPSVRKRCMVLIGNIYRLSDGVERDVYLGVPGVRVVDDGRDEPHDDDETNHHVTEYVRT